MRQNGRAVNRLWVSTQESRNPGTQNTGFYNTGKISVTLCHPIPLKPNLALPKATWQGYGADLTAAIVTG